MARSFTFKDKLHRIGASAAFAALIMAGLAPVDGANADTRNIVRNYNKTVVVQPAYATPDVATIARYKGFQRGKTVAFNTKKRPGTIIVNTRTNRLYYVLGNGLAVQYPIASAKPGFEWSGSNKVSRKVKWPDWRPPAAMRKRSPELPAFMAGGPKNPLGARAIYLGSTMYRIHGTNAPSSIGQSASSGCIRMHNADVEELYQHVKLGAQVIVL
jgi:lipoprotein-anchoring transpeptidase ErfK/SrfK